MATDTELIKLPFSLGIEINKILAEKIQFTPRKNKIGLLRKGSSQRSAFSLTIVRINENFRICNGKK